MRVIIVNGPMGVGKTVTGKHIAEKNPGTAFIDGDWCMDIHPFVGNRETKAMAVDNILHMIGNYQKCKGYGIRLMECIEESFPYAAEFNLDTPCWNERTNAFYKRLGYRIIKVEDGFVFYQKRKSEPKWNYNELS